MSDYEVELGSASSVTERRLSPNVSASKGRFARTWACSEAKRKERVSQRALADHSSLTGFSISPDVCCASAWSSMAGDSATMLWTDIWMNSSKLSSCCRTKPLSSKYALMTIQQASCHNSSEISWSSSSWKAESEKAFCFVCKFLKVLKCDLKRWTRSRSYHRRARTWLLMSLTGFEDCLTSISLFKMRNTNCYFEIVESRQVIAIYFARKRFESSKILMFS